ncbi:Trm112 family protein [Ornithinimicrobium sp. INDO-MA30-4]|uniref:Trm112 family protein n=1 Tax=Ornithinimicrobium sp. INDO-MA30-4 TaxID=2908651 RepID=UPI001F2038DD|nr:hypothetical protein [Ornithinimicrobium sp. INDO-MA30-4]UJH71420.1 hypothetical protein L0A91_06795 [Ornithinimicrobium sp. INDO-MA30-4]
MTSQIDPWVRDILRCPVGQHKLLDDTNDAGEPILVCEQDCPTEGQRRSYPVRDGIPVMLADESTISAR